MNSQLWWYSARAAGVVAWALVVASVIFGLALSRRFVARPRPAWVLDFHRYLGALAVVFTAIHVSSIGLDSYVSFGVAETFVPLQSTWHPAAVAWGIVAMYLLVAIEGTSLLQRHLPRRLWRAVHFLSFVLFGVVTLHALSAGTDTSGGLAYGLAWTSVGVVALLTGVRIVAAGRAGERDRRLPLSPPRHSPNRRRTDSWSAAVDAAAARVEAAARAEQPERVATSATTVAAPSLSFEHEHDLKSAVLRRP
jgi:sulfoxide reductase heme-binding subunit YedZ